MSEVVVALSYFDKKVGPQVYIEKDEKLGEDIKMVLNQIFDQTTTEGFFWHSLSSEGYSTSLNYYFEVRSEWARGSREMLMISLVFKEKLSTEKEHEVLAWVIDFVQKMRGTQEIFKAFYYKSTTVHQPPAIIKEAKVQYELVEEWVQTLLLSTKEEIRKKTDEENIANLMLDEAIYATVKKLSKHPVKIEELKTWFREQKFLRLFEKIMDMLEQEKFIFINNIGHETFVLLVKDVSIQRVPPTSILEMLDGEPTVDPLVTHYIKIVTEYFETYKPNKEENHKLYSFLARPKHFNIISELRKEPILKTQLNSILRQGPVLATKINVLEELRAADVIEEFSIDGKTFIILKTDITIQVQFPEYIQKALPEQPERPDIQSRFTMHKAQQDLADLFKDQTVEISAEAISDASSQEEVAVASNIFDESPFDVIVDKISLKFANNTPKSDGPQNVSRKSNSNNTKQ